MLAAMALAALVAGCNRKGAESRAAAPAQGPVADQTAAPESQGDGTAPGAAARPEPSKDGLKSLCADRNFYISNLAKHALASWEAKDYSSAVTGMRKIMSLCRSEDQRAAALSSLALLKLEAEKAAASGNANAREAAARLTQAGAP